MDTLCHLSYSNHLSLYALPLVNVIIARLTCIGRPTLRANIMRMPPIHLSRIKNFKDQISKKQGRMKILQNPFYDLHAFIFKKASMSTFIGLYMRIPDYKRMRSNASFRTIVCALDSTTTY